MHCKNHRRWILIIAFVASVTMFAAAAITVHEGKNEPLPQLIGGVEAAATEQQTLPAPFPLYTVSSWQGRVAVFEYENQTPVMVLETPVTSLPEADQTALAEGIAVYDSQMLASMLEDYGS